MNRRGAEEFFYFSPSVQIHRRREDINVIPEILDSSFFTTVRACAHNLYCRLGRCRQCEYSHVIFIFARNKNGDFYGFKIEFSLAIASVW